MDTVRYTREFVSLALGKFLAKGVLPCSVIAREPPIIAAFAHDFFKNLPVILKALPSGRRVYALLKLGYERESPEQLKEEQDNYLRLKNIRDDIECTYLCNSPKEVENLEGCDMRAVLCNHNTFIDETRFPILPRSTKLYDAVYLSRLTPCKRHHLASKIKQLLVIGGYLDYEKDYALKEMATIPHAMWLIKVRGFTVHQHFASAHIGLCLSDREGAMYASTEYLLCGLPVVSTPNIGGRDVFFDPEYVRTVDPTPEAVAKGVYELIDKEIDPFYIRGATLKKIQVHRENYVSLLESIFEKEKKPFDREKAWDTYFFHKLGLRTTVSPYVSWKKLLRRTSFE